MKTKNVGTKGIIYEERSTLNDERSLEPLFPPNLLRAAAALFEQRNAQYGDTYRRYGSLLVSLFPAGGVPPITTPEEAIRLNLIMMCLAKLQRYAHNFEDGGHLDSVRDLQVYGAMLEENTKH